MTSYVQTGVRRMRLLIFAVLALLVLAAQAAPLLKAGDRVVIYGDSITQQLLYSRYLQQYLNCRYPDLNVVFYNAGWSGDQAPGAFNRLERDVFSLNPTVVTLFFGMNDGRYTTLNDNILKTYRDNMEKIIVALQAKGIRVVVYTPGCVDPDRNANHKAVNYNGNLEALGAAAIELAKKYNCAYADVFHPMLEFQNAQKAKDPKFTMIADAVHPQPAGHLVMTYAMLKGFEAEPMPALGSYDAATGKANGLRVVSKDDMKIALEADLTVVPFWFDANNGFAMSDSGFLSMAGQKLTVTGVQGTYDLMVNDVRVGRYSGEQLASGVYVPGTFSQPGRMLHDAIQRKEDIYFNAWRNVRLQALGQPQDMPEARQNLLAAYEKMLLVNDTYQKMACDLSQQKGKVTLTLNKALEGGNLALDKKYDCSDPNTHGWGIGRLTDGSYQASSAHCFATNESPTFPKTATIDLEKIERIGAVSLGVPNFGSTKTIIVSVSADGTNFTQVGTHEFAIRTEARHLYTFAPVDARYVRLTYPDQYNEVVGYDKNFMFTTEAEVFGPQAK